MDIQEDKVFKSLPQEFTLAVDNKNMIGETPIQLEEIKVQESDESSKEEYKDLIEPESRQYQKQQFNMNAVSEESKGENYRQITESQLQQESNQQYMIKEHLISTSSHLPIDEGVACLDQREGLGDNDIEIVNFIKGNKLVNSYCDQPNLRAPSFETIADSRVTDVINRLKVDQGLPPEARRDIKGDTDDKKANTLYEPPDSLCNEETTRIQGRPEYLADFSIHKVRQSYLSNLNQYNQLEYRTKSKNGQ